MLDLAANAINAALASDWKKAVALNSQILKENKDDADCLNRLGKAYLELGQNKKAASAFRQVLKIDKYNPIAQKNLARALSFRPVPCSLASAPPPKNTPLSGGFLEEPGKTRLVALVNIAPASVLLKQKQAEVIRLVPKKHGVVVTDLAGTYLGALPDDLGHRLAALIKGGNQYCALTKSVAKNGVVVFIREIFRSKRFANTPSFTAGNADYFSFIREEASGSEEIAASHEGDDTAEGFEETPALAKLHQDEEPPEAA